MSDLIFKKGDIITISEVPRWYKKAWRWFKRVIVKKEETVEYLTFTGTSRAVYGQEETEK